MNNTELIGDEIQYSSPHKASRPHIEEVKQAWQLVPCVNQAEEISIENAMSEWTYICGHYRLIGLRFGLRLMVVHSSVTEG